VKVTLLDALSVIPLWVAKPKQSLFQEIILLVPEAEGNINKAVRVRDTRDAVLSPAKGSRSGGFVGESESIEYISHGCATDSTCRSAYGTTHRHSPSSPPPLEAID